MQQESLLEAHRLSDAEPTSADRELESPRTGRCTQGTALHNSASHSNQVRSASDFDGKRKAAEDAGLP